MALSGVDPRTALRSIEHTKLRELYGNCEKTLGNPDYERAQSQELAGLHLLSAAIPPHGTVPKERIYPYLERIERFMLLFTHILRSTQHSTTIIWGVVGVATDAVSNVPNRIPETLSMLENLTQHLESLQQSAWLVQNLPSTSEAMLEAYVYFVQFWANVTRHLRRNERGPNAPATTQQEPNSKMGWDIICESYELALKTNGELIARLIHEQEMMQSVMQQQQVQHQQASQPTPLGPVLQQLVDLNEGRINSITSLPSDFPASTFASTAHDLVRLPCYVIPLSKNLRFQGRDDLMKNIRLILDHNADASQFQSLALYGLGGIGKTQAALAYAHEQREKKLPAVFWINSEGPIDILQGFTTIALKLGLSTERDSQRYEQNKILVLDWLQTTHTPWLLVFDNVETIDLIRQCWPRAMQGSVLVTSRNDEVAIDPCDKGIDVPVFSPDEGSQFLLDLVDRVKYSKDEQDAAKELSESLGGLPLALNLMAQQIKLGRKKVRQLLEEYQKDPRRHHKTPKRGIKNSTYPHSLETVFRASFALLIPEASAILGAMSFVSPDGVPEALFQSSDLPDALQFCHETESFDDAMSSLFSTSLSSKDPDNGTIHVHRLVQAQFRESLNPEDQYKTFMLTIKLLLEAFPKHGKGRSLRNEFTTCKKFIIHIMALLDRLKEFGFSSQAPGDFEQFCELAANCGWYLMEIGSWDEFFTVTNIALEVCEDKTSLLYADLCNTIGQVECERGRAHAALPYIQKSLAIRELKLPKDSEELSDLYNNYANVINVEWKDDEALEEALKWYKRALAIDETKPLSERSKVLHVRHLNFGTLYTCQGRYVEALEQLRLGHKYCLKTFGADTHWDATAEYKIGNVYYFQEMWAEAKTCFDRAIKIFLVENKLHPTTSATKLKLATIALKQGRVDESIDTLLETKLICQLNELKKGDKGDTARIIRRLSDAFQLKGDQQKDVGMHTEAEASHKKAAELKTEAETYRKEIQGERYAQLPDCERSYNLMVYKAFW